MEEEKPEQEIYARMAQLCSKSEQCSAEVIKKIKALGGNSLMTASIIDRLEKENFLSDLRFVQLYVREKFRINRWGRIKIHYYLKMKGLAEELIQKGFEEIDENEYVELLVKTMKEKAGHVTGGNKYEKMGQVIRFAQGRGFEPEMIHRYLSGVIS